MSPRMRAIERLAHDAEAFKIVTAGLIGELILHIRRPGVGRPDSRNIAFETAGIIAQAITMRVGIEGCGAEVDGESSFFERSLLDAAASAGGRDNEVDTECREVCRSVVGDELTVTAHRSTGAVKYSAFGWILPAESPIPVGLGAFVAAFIAEGFLIEVDVVAMKGVEETLKVHV